VGEHTVPPLKAFYVPNTKGFIKQMRGAWSLSHTFREKKFEHIILIHVPWWVALAAFLAGIRQRTGVASQWFSWVFYNNRLRQKRSKAEKNEAHYNLDLISFALGAGQNLPLLPAQLKPDIKSVEKWKKHFTDTGVNIDKLVVIHPGMGGSARNWPPTYYRELAESLILQGVSVVVTGTPHDEVIIQQSGILGLKEVIRVTTQNDDILAVLSLARAIVVPSTGVAHLGASLGVPVIGIYSPVKVQSPRRWAPLGEKVQVLVPNVPCPGEFSCLGPVCKYYDCMEQITVDSVRACVMDKL
jgi:ADP-heptose:LPS heptosyltransferase